MNSRPVASEGSPFFGMQEVPLAALDSDGLVRQLERHWSGWRGGDRLPGRQDLDPLKLGPKLLPWLFLLDVLREAEGLDYHYRLVGTGNVDLVGRDATGRRASDIFGRDSTRFVLDSFDDTVLRGEPTYWQAVVPNDRFGQATIERGLFPLAGEDGRIDMLMCIAVPTRL